MKKYIWLLAIGLTINTLQAQEVSDAVRYSQDNLNGTARFRAMSGAFGALGGDLSSLNVNPAGSAIFANNQMGLTLTNFSNKNNSNYFGTTNSTKNNSIDLNQAGAVFVFENNVKSNWSKVTIGINYENANNFTNDFFSSGTNRNNTVADYFLFYANRGNNGAPVPQQFVNTEQGESISDLYSFLGNNLPNSQFPGLSGYDAQQAFLGYQAFIIDAVNENNPNSPFSSNVPAANYFHQNAVFNTGYNGKLTFNIATSYKDKFYFGLNLNSHFTDYIRSTRFTERNDAPVTNDFRVSQIQFDNDLNTYGTGFSFQIGAIAKVTKELRFGLAHESSTWYRLTDELSQSVVAISRNSTETLPADVVNPNVINVYQPYKLQTPSKTTVSLAYVFGKKGLISVDYAMRNFSSTAFKPKNDAFFMGLNNAMSNTLDNTGEVRVGGEYKIKALSLRAGYRYEQSPYKNTAIMGDLTGYSAGLGYNFGSTKLDLSYANATRNTQQGFFNQGFTDGAKIANINNNVSLTLLFEL